MSNLRNLDARPSPAGQHASVADQQTDKLTASLKGARPVSDMYVDKQGTAVRLYNGKAGLVGLSRRAGAPLLAKLAARPGTAWDLVYIPEVGAIHVWPTLQAAAKQRDNFTIATRLNPFVDKTLAECAEMLKAKGFVERFGEDGRASWVNDRIGRWAYLDPGNNGENGSRPEAPHVEMFYAKPIAASIKPPERDKSDSDGTKQRWAGDGQTKAYAQKNLERFPVRERFIEKKKFPLNPMDPRWDKVVNKVKDSYVRHEHHSNHAKRRRGVCTRAAQGFGY